jgi:DNA-binding response OmpR family regulator
MYRILLVEDDLLVQEAFQEALKAEDFEAISCESGEQALRRAAIEKPDLAVIDVGLPDMSGLDVCRRLQAGPKTRHIPFLIMSGQAVAVKDRVAGLKLGAEDYLLKPLSLRVLISRIKSILRVSGKPC